MKKIFIISYFFPPCNVTASQRIFSWYRHLHAFGYYPVVITRKWEKEAYTYSDVNQISSENVVVEKNGWGEVHYLPYSGNLRDRLISKYGMERYTFIRKFLSLLELVFENFTIAVNPYRSFYYYTKKLAQIEKFHGLVISSGPFPQFAFGYLLKRNLNLQWIADYRDDWSTEEIIKSKNIIKKFIKKLNRRSEKKWVDSAAAFTTISPYYRDKIKKITTTKGFVLQNGFSEIIAQNNMVVNNGKLIYNGTLYPTQPIEKFLNSLYDYNRSNSEKLSVDFPGLGIDSNQQKRVEQFAGSLGIKDRLNITQRIPKNEVIEKQQNALALLMFGHTGLKGIPSSKIYEYLSLGKPIILFEPDGDILEEIVGNYNLGFVIGKSLTFEEAIKEILRLHAENRLKPDIGYISKFSRINQVKLLAEIMDNHFLI